MRWLIANVPAERWPDIAKALQIIQAHGGFGAVVLNVRDGTVSGRVRAEVSLG